MKDDRGSTGAAVINKRTRGLMNQCDGCRAGKPLIEGKWHDMSKDPGVYREWMYCERVRYEA